jgi:hypothetical protein
MFRTYHRTFHLHLLSYNGSLVTVTMTKAKENFHMAELLLSYILQNATLTIKKYSIPCTGLDRSRGFQEDEAFTFLDNQHMKVLRLSAQGIGRHYPPPPPSKYSWYSLLLEAESTPGPYPDHKGYVS